MTGWFADVRNRSVRANAKIPITINGLFMVRSPLNVGLTRGDVRSKPQARRAGADSDFDLQRQRAKVLGWDGVGRKRTAKAYANEMAGCSPAFGNPARSLFDDPRRLCGPRSHEVCLCRFRYYFK